MSGENFRSRALAYSHPTRQREGYRDAIVGVQVKLFAAMHLTAIFIVNSHDAIFSPRYMNLTVDRVR